MKKLLLFGALALTINSFGQVPSYAPSNGLVAWWSFNGNANDESGNGYNGTVNGCTLTNDMNSNANSAYSFDGTSYIAIQGSGNIDFSGGYTFSCWFKPTAVKMASLVDKQAGINANCNGEDGFRTCIRSNGDVASSTGCYGTGTGSAFATSNYQVNQWYHCVGTIDTDDSVRIYMDGNFVVSELIAVGLSGIVTTKDIDFGRGTWAALYEYFEGDMDEVGIWNRALSSCEILDLYNEQLNSTVFTVTQNGAQLSADQAGATYQWLDCDNNYAIINGETNQSYTPGATGNYAVEVSMNSCVDTSSCYLVDYTGIEELMMGKKELVKIVDLMGREVPYEKNKVLIYVYSDGTTERVFEFE